MIICNKSNRPQTLKINDQEVIIPEYGEKEVDDNAKLEIKNLEHIEIKGSKGE